jgi:flagellar protein FliS
MTNQMASLEYRRASTQHASVVGLVIALHDTLIGDLKRAADAMERNDIQTRCDQLIHGFKVLTQLEAMLDMNNGGKTAVNIRRFYAHIRGQMLSAQFKLSAAILHKQAAIVLEVRQAWQQMEAKNAQPGIVERIDKRGYQGGQLADEDTPDSEPRTSFSCAV